MLKTITKTVQIRLDELIKYVRENKKTLFKNRVEITFSTKNNNEVTFYQHGELTLDNWISSDDLFEVEVEKPITEDTFFEQCVIVFKDKSTISTPLEHNIKFIKKYYKNIKYIYALIDGKLELIYEVKDNNREE